MDPQQAAAAAAAAQGQQPAGTPPAQAQPNPAQLPNQAHPQQVAAGIVDNRGVPGSPHPGVMPVPDESGRFQPNDPQLAAQLAAQQAAQAQAPADPNAPVPGQGQPQRPVSMRDIAVQMGFQGAAGYQDDASFVRAVLAQGAAARSQVDQLSRAIGQLQSQPQLPQQQAQAQIPANPVSQVWNPPEYNPAWEALVSRAADGTVTPIPGAPPEVVGKLTAYHAYRRAFADKLTSDPISTLRPLIEQVATEKAQQMAMATTAQAQEQSFIQNFVAQNSGWLHARDANGNVISNPANGQPMLSQMGYRFQQHVAQAQQLGIQGAINQEAYARNQLRHDVAMEQLGQQQAQQQAHQAVVGANRRPNTGGSVPDYGAVVQPGLNPSGSASLRDQLSAALALGGITDQMVDLG